MKRIVAFVKPKLLDDVIFALHEIDDFPGATMCEVQGIASGPRDHLAAFPHSIRLELVCEESRVEEILAAIRKSAHTGLAGDGKIYVSAVEASVPI